MEIVVSSRQIELVPNSWTMSVVSGGVTNVTATTNPANSIAINPTGSIEASNLQDALREIDSEINAIADLTVLFENKLI